MWAIKGYPYWAGGMSWHYLGPLFTTEQKAKEYIKKCSLKRPFPRRPFRLRTVLEDCLLAEPIYDSRMLVDPDSIYKETGGR